MPTLFARLDTALGDNELVTRLPETVSQLASVAGLVAGLIQNPPDSVGDFGRVVSELPLPDLLGGDFSASLASIQGAVPTDLSPIVGGLTTQLGQFQGRVTQDLVGVLTPALEAMRAVYRLTQVDLTCAPPTEGQSDAGGSPAGGGGADAPQGGAPASGRVAIREQVQAVHTALDHLPSPFTVGGLLEWLANVAGALSKGNVPPLTLPVVGEVLDPLTTMAAWSAADANGLRDRLVQSVQDLTAFVQSTGTGLLSGLSADLAAAQSQMQADLLAEIADALTTRLGELLAAMRAGNVGNTGAAVADIGARLDTYDALRPSLEQGVLRSLPALNARLAALPDDLAEQMGHLVSVLRPNPTVGRLTAAFGQPQGAAGEEAAVQAIEQWFQPVTEWVRGLAGQLDLKAIQEPLGQVANAAQEAVDALDQGLLQITVEVRGIFGQVESLLEGVDTQALRDQIEQAIEQFGAEVLGQIQGLFSPARDAIAQVFEAIDGSLDQFTPEQVVEALRQVLTSVTSVFEDPQVVSAIQQIHTTLENVEAQIEQLSFAPLTDEVIAALDQIGQALQAIDPAQLNTILQAALQAALAVLPDDLEPVTTPLIDEFGQLIEAGPVPLLETVKAQPEKLMDQVRAFEPARLLGGTLSQPYNQLLGQMEAFKPSTLLAPVKDQIDQLKARLEEQVNPGRLVGLLEPPFDQLLGSFQRLNPAQLVEPIDRALSETIDEILDALPTDEILGEVDKVLAAIQEVVDLGQSVVDILAAINGLLAGLAYSEGQLAAWKNAILDKVSAIGDISPLQAAFGQLTAALDQTQQVGLDALRQAALAPLLDALTALNPGLRHTRLLQAYRDARAALPALPDSPQKTAIGTVLDRFDPLSPAFAAPYQSLLACRTTLEQANQGVQALLQGWDARYHGPDGTLAGYRVTSVTAAQARGWIEEEMDASFLGPLRLLLARAEALAAPVAAAFAQVTQLVTLVQTKVDELLLGPGSLGGIRDAVDGLIQRLRGLNLSFLTDSLNQLFEELLDKVRALDPVNLKEALDASFHTMLDGISVDLILPVAALEALDDDFQELVDKLRALDPEKLVTQVVQPEYEEKIVPLIEAIDVTSLLDAIIERLRSLDEELKGEMQRVNDAFRSMKGSVPLLSGGVSVSL